MKDATAATDKAIKQVKAGTFVAKIARLAAIVEEKPRANGYKSAGIDPSTIRLPPPVNGGKHNKKQSFPELPPSPVGQIPPAIDPGMETKRRLRPHIAKGLKGCERKLVEGVRPHYPELEQHLVDRIYNSGQSSKFTGGKNPRKLKRELTSNLKEMKREITSFSQQKASQQNALIDEWDRMLHEGQAYASGKIKIGSLTAGNLEKHTRAMAGTAPPPSSNKDRMAAAKFVSMFAAYDKKGTGRINVSKLSQVLAKSKLVKKNQAKSIVNLARDTCGQGANMNPSIM